MSNKKTQDRVLTPAEAARQAALDNRSRQLNENNHAYWKSRGLTKPADEAAGSRDDSTETE